MRKKLRQNDYYDDYDNENEYPSAVTHLPTHSPLPESSAATVQPPVPQERQKPKYCFV